MYICKNGNMILNDLPVWDNGINKGKINRKAMVGMSLNIKYNGLVYKKVKILGYIDKKFKIKYNDTIKEMHGSSFFKCQFGKILNIESNNKQIINNIVYIHIINNNGEQFTVLYSGNHVEDVMKSTWCIGIRNGRVGYVYSNNYKGKMIRLHQVDFELKNGRVIDHINNNPLDNRFENLRVVTRAENNKNIKSKNILGLTGLHKYKNGWSSSFTYNSIAIYTKVKYDLNEAKLDNLIAQRYLKYKHNEDMFYLLDDLPEKRIKEVTDLLDEKILKGKNKILKVKEYNHDIEEKDGYYILRKNGKEMLFDCDLEFIKNKRMQQNYGYWNCIFIKNNIKITNIFHKELLQLNPNEYKDYNIHIDHLNNNTSDNRYCNLIITTSYGNMCNKQGKGYKKISNGNYRVSCMSNYKYWSLIGGIKQPFFQTEQEAIREIERRRLIIANNRVKLYSKSELDNLITYCFDNNYILKNRFADLDLGYLYWKGILKANKIA